MYMHKYVYNRLPRRLHGKESACQYRTCSRHGFSLWVRKLFWRRKWQTTPEFLLKKSHGRRSVVGYSPWGRKETWLSDWACMHTFTCVAKKWKKSGRSSVWIHYDLGLWGLITKRQNPRASQGRGQTRKRTNEVLFLRGKRWPSSVR